jgi:hypothetical protein
MHTRTLCGLPKKKGLGFIFVSTYLKLSVPEFDGIAFNPSTGRALWNVSMEIPHSLMDQLFRASLSIPLNISEGNGRWHKGEKRNFF